MMASVEQAIEVIISSFSPGMVGCVGCWVLQGKESMGLQACLEGEFLLSHLAADLDWMALIVSIFPRDIIEDI